MTTIKERLITFGNNLQTAKTNLASAITSKGVTASGTDSFGNLVTKIGNIQTGGGSTIPAERDYDFFYYRSHKNYQYAYANDVNTDFKLAFVAAEDFLVGYTASTFGDAVIALSGTKTDNLMGLGPTLPAGYSESYLLNLELHLVFAEMPMASEIRNLSCRIYLEPVKKIVTNYGDYQNRQVVLNLFSDGESVGGSVDGAAYANGTEEDEFICMIPEYSLNMNQTLFLFPNPSHYGYLVSSYSAFAAYVCKKA